MRHEAIIKQLDQIEQWQHAEIVEFVANELPKLEYDQAMYIELRREVHQAGEELDPLVRKAIEDIKIAVDRTHQLRFGLKKTRWAS